MGSVNSYGTSLWSVEVVDDVSVSEVFEFSN
jgi:hypothetical protein